MLGLPAPASRWIASSLTTMSPSGMSRPGTSLRRLHEAVGDTRLEQAAPDADQDLPDVHARDWSRHSCPHARGWSIWARLRESQPRARTEPGPAPGSTTSVGSASPAPRPSAARPPLLCCAQPWLSSPPAESTCSECVGNGFPKILVVVAQHLIELGIRHACTRPPDASPIAHRSLPPCTGRGIGLCPCLSRCPAPWHDTQQVAGAQTEPHHAESQGR